MARKANTTITKPAPPADQPSIIEDEVVAQNTQNTEGEGAAGRPAAPQDVPAEGQAAAQGGEEEFLHATQDAVGNVEPSPAAGATVAGGPGEARIIVTCLAEGGRRRLNRRWPSGPTEVPAGELTADDIAVLRGDPRFSVTTPAA